MREISSNDIRGSVYAALMTALIIVGAYISVPVPGSPVPIVLQNLFVILAGLLLGWKWGLASVGLYLFLGALGLPVFSAARGGLAHILGPTGGYLIGFLPAVMISGAISERRRSFLVLLLGGVLGAASVYVLGVPWLMASTSLSLPAALAAGLIPFVVADLVKTVVAAGVVRAVDATEILLPREDAA